MNELRDLTVAEYMSATVVSIPPETIIDGIAEVMCEHSIAALPVIDKTGNLLGIVSQTDVLKGVAMHLEQPTAADLMTRKVLTIEARASVSDLVSLLEDRKIKHVPVVLNGRVVGMVTQTDLVRDVLARAVPEHALSDERLRKIILDKLELVEPSLQKVPDFCVNDGIVHFWGAPPTAREIAEVFRALRAAQDS